MRLKTTDFVDAICSQSCVNRVSKVQGLSPLFSRFYTYTTSSDTPSSHFSLPSFQIPYIISGCLLLSVSILIHSSLGRPWILAPLELESSSVLFLVSVANAAIMPRQSSSSGRFVNLSSLSNPTPSSNVQNPSSSSSPMNPWTVQAVGSTTFHRDYGLIEL